MKWFGPAIGKHILEITFTIASLNQDTFEIASFGQFNIAYTVTDEIGASHVNV